VLGMCQPHIRHVLTMPDTFWPCPTWVNSFDSSNTVQTSPGHRLDTVESVFFWVSGFIGSGRTRDITYKHPQTLNLPQIYPALSLSLLHPMRRKTLICSWWLISWCHGWSRCGGGVVVISSSSSLVVWSDAVVVVVWSGVVMISWWWWCHGDLAIVSDGLHLWGKLFLLIRPLSAPLSFSLLSLSICSLSISLRDRESREIQRKQREIQSREGKEQRGEGEKRSVEFCVGFWK